MKKFILSFLAISVCLAAMLFGGCSAQADLSDYVSEFRSDIYIGTQGEYSVFASYSRREYPYTADGNVGDMSDVFEIALTAPDNTKTYSVRYSLGGKEYSSELSFDSVRLVHRCSQTIPAPNETTISFTITIADDDSAEPIAVSAASIKTEKTLQLADLLEKVRTAESDRFAALTSGGSFAGELYVRLLYDNERCFYYVGLTDRNGNTYAMLTDAETGEIIATRGE